MKQIYLAGAIAGKTFDECNNWRKLVEAHLVRYPNVAVRNPLRGKEHFRQSAEKFTKFEYASNPITTQKGIVRRDFNDVITSDCLLVNLLGTTEKSIGSLMELAWAYQLRIPVVLLMEPEGNINDHLFVRECAIYQTDNMWEALDLCLHILGEIK